MDVSLLVKHATEVATASVGPIRGSSNRLPACPSPERRQRTGRALVSCHVEHILDDDVWDRFSAFARGRPAGTSIVSLVRPPDASEQHARDLWLERVRVAADWGPIGHHSHFGGAGTARPTGDSPPPPQLIREEALWLQSAGLECDVFCGGGWFIDGDTAGALARLGYIDCTATRFRHSYLASGEARASLAAPAVLEVSRHEALVEVPTTHTARLLARDIALGELPEFVHLYFHDYDLVAPRRRAAIGWAIGALARRRTPTDFATEAARARAAGRRNWGDVREG